MRPIIFAFLIVSCLSALCSPYIVRFLDDEQLIFGEETYYHARISEKILKGEISASDTLIYNERPYLFGPYHVVLAYTSKLIGIEAASIILPILFGLVSFILFILILQKLGADEFKLLLISSLVIISPAFIATFSESNSHAFAIFLYTVGFYLILHRPLAIFGFLLLLSTVLFGLFNSVLLFVILLGHYTKENRRKLLLLFIFILSFIFSLVYYLVYRATFFPVNATASLVSDLGGDGFGLFTFILLFSGIMFSWKERYRFSLPFLMLIYLMTCFILAGSYVLSYLAFVVPIFSGEGVYRILGMDWQLKVIKNLAVLIIACGLLFSTVSYVNRLSASGPSFETVSALTWLQSQPDGLVFSHYSNGFWIEYFSQKPVFLDGFLVSDFKKRFNVSNEIFNSRNMAATKKQLDLYSIKYIFIDEEMTSGEVWSKPESGLLFLFRNNETFGLIYNNTGAQVWEYKGLK